MILSKGFIQHQIYSAEDLTTEEKITALEGLELLNDSLIKIVIIEAIGTRDVFNLGEAQGDKDVAGYFKHRNKLRKITGQKKAAATPGKYTAVKKGSMSASKKIPKYKSLGSKIAAKIKHASSVLKKTGSVYFGKGKAAAPKVMKAAKVAAKAM